MPRKHCTSRVRNRRKHVRKPSTSMVKLFAYRQDPGTTWREWTFRTVSQKQARTFVESGDAEEVVRQVDGGELEVVGYKQLKPIRLVDSSPCSLTHRTTDAVGEFAMRMSRVRRGLPVEPLTLPQVREVERFVMFPTSTGTRASLAAVRTTPEERKLAIFMDRNGSLPKLMGMAA